MRVFKAVSELGSFTAAANALGTTQPFISRTVAALEKRTGMSLLRRSTRAIHVTEDGRAFLAASHRVLSELEAMEASLASAETALKGEIRVTAPTTFGMDQVVPLLAPFLKKHPDVSIYLELSDVVTDLLGGGYDVAIRMGRLKDSLLLSRKLCRLQRLVVASPAYIAEHGTPQHPEELRSHNCYRWVGALDHLNRWPFMVDGEKHFVDIQGNFESANGVAASAMCIKGVVIARMAEHLAIPSIRQGDLVELLPEHRFDDDAGIFAVYANERYIHPRIRSFVDHIVESFRVPPWEM